jgi:molybdopterin-guanine dinucleotide biosynthesis protein B
MKVFGFAGYSGSGKTTLLEKLIPIFVRSGLKVSVIKHAHHRFDVDKPGKDSYRHREAGASEVLVCSSQRWALMHELRDELEPTLQELLSHLSPCDLALVEGFKNEPIPKLEVYRSVVTEGFLHPQNPHIVAIASDQHLEVELPQLDINQPEAIAIYILNYLGLNSSEVSLLA